MASNRWLFSHWSGSAIATESVLNFLMQPGYSVTANFVPNPFTPVIGSYNGLFAPTNVVAQESAGFFTARTTGKGTYSGSLRVGSKKYAFSGRFALNGTATNGVRRGKDTPLAMEMTLLAGMDTSWIIGSVSGGGWAAELRAHRAVFNARTRPAPYAGKYTVLIPGSEVTGATNMPGGDGFGAVSVSAGGVARLSGSLADGTALGQSAPVSLDGYWPVYAGLYGGRGSVWSWLLFDTNQPGSDLAGGLRWIKPVVATTRYYPAGFTSVVDAAGSIYRVPLGNTNRVLAFSNGLVVFSGGNLTNTFLNLVTLVPGGKVTNTSTNKLTFTVVKSSGLFNGNVVVPETGKTKPFKGALFPNGTNASGYFLGTNASGRVYFGPAPE